MHTVLIVEDEKMIRQGIKTMIQRSGVLIDNILECNNGISALDILKMQKVDVMFTDIRMPKMDGLQLVKALQELEEKPMVVAISGYDDFSYAVEMLRLGAKEYLLKPIDREKMREVMIRLEKEIVEKEKSLNQNKNVSYQYLKYIMMQDDIADAQNEMLIDQNREYFYKNEFVVCCMDATGGEIREDEYYIYLGDMEDREIYILEVDFLDVLLKDDFVNRYVGVSQPHVGLEVLRTAYREALEARKEAFFQGKMVVHWAGAEKREASFELDKSTMQQLAQMLGTDRWEEAIRQLEQIFNNAKLGAYRAENFEERLQDFLKEIGIIYRNVIDSAQMNTFSFLQIYSYPCLEDLKDEIIGWLEQLCTTLNSHFDDYKNKQKIQQAISYIQENYDKDLNMAVVSNHISMNYSLFSYVFKQYTGNNFVNYLKEIRMKEAKRLLEDSDMKIIDISQTIGYENEKHFMKTFKAVCGVSPTQYRKNMQLKGEKS